MKKMNIRVNEMVKFLDVSANTVYNYRTMDDEDLPVKVTEMIFDLLNVENFQEARDVLMKMSYEKREEIASSMKSLLESVRIVSPPSVDEGEFGERKYVNHVNEDLGSNVYVQALLYEIKKVVKSKDDYDFISYVKKYNKK